MSSIQIKDTLRIDTKPLFISIRKVKHCLFARRCGYVGTRLFGYSIVLRIFNKTIL